MLKLSRKTVFKTIAVRVKTTIAREKKDSVEKRFDWKIRWTRFRWNKKRILHSCANYWKSTGGREEVGQSMWLLLYNNVFTNCCLLKLGFYPATGTHRKWLYFPWCLHFKGWFQGIWERDSWVLKVSQSKRRKRIYNCEFSKVNALIKGDMSCFVWEQI